MADNKRFSPSGLSWTDTEKPQIHKCDLVAPKLPRVQGKEGNKEGRKGVEEKSQILMPISVCPTLWSIRHLNKY